MNMHHAELVVVTARGTGHPLPPCEIPVLLGLEHNLAGLALEHVEALVPRYRQEVPSGAGTRFFGLGDLGRLFEGDTTCLQRAAHLVRVSQALRGLNGLLGLTDRRPGHPRDLGGIIDLPGQHGPAERGEPLDARVFGGRFAGPVRGQQLRLEVRIGLVEQLGGFVQRFEFHACHYGEGLGRKRALIRASSKEIKKSGLSAIERGRDG
jgi:hypothetical protein